MTLYDRMKQACEERDTNISTVLRAVGLSGGNTGNWKAGKSPSIDAVILIADYLHMSLDELVYGHTASLSRASELTPDEKEWLDIIHSIPEDRWDVCKDFLRTHMAVPERHTDRMDV